MALVIKEVGHEVIEFDDFRVSILECAHYSFAKDVSFTKPTPQPGANAFIVSILIYALSFDRIRVKYQAIIGIIYCANFAKDGR